MRGPEAAAELAAAQLAAAMPGKLLELEARLDVPVGTIPAPALVLPYDEPNLALEDWPAVFVVVEELLALALSDVNSDGGELYRGRYRALVFAWVRADGYAEVDLLRKRYVLALRELLLERKSLTPPATYGSETYGQPASAVTVAPATIRESYSPPLVDAGGRTIAGAFLTVELYLEEQLAGPAPLGTALELEATPATLERGDTAVVPPHPAL